MTACPVYMVETIIVADSEKPENILGDVRRALGRGPGERAFSAIAGRVGIARWL